MRRTAAVAAVVLALSPSLARRVRADAIGPPPTVEGCTPGSVSTVAGRMTHGQLAYCAPAVCMPDETRAGLHCVARGLQIAYRAVPHASGHGIAPPYPTKLHRDPSFDEDSPVGLAEVVGTCTPDPNLGTIGVRGNLLGGPTTDQVALGCQPLSVWMPDTAPAPPVAATPSTPAVAPTTSAPAAASPHAHGGCSATGATDTPLAALALFALATIALVAARRGAAR